MMYYVFVKKDVVIDYNVAGQANVELEWVYHASYHDEEWARGVCDGLSKEYYETLIIKGEILHLSMPGV